MSTSSVPNYASSILQDSLWNMDTGTSSHLNSDSCHSILPTLHRPLHLHNVLVTPNIIKNLIYVRQFTRDNNSNIKFDAFRFSVKDFLTRHILLRCDNLDGTRKTTQRLNLHVSHISPIPKSPSLALSDPYWRDAIFDEYNALIKNDTWVLIPRPSVSNIVRSLWLFWHKFHADGSLVGIKPDGIDCDETFSSIVKATTIRTVLSLALTRHWLVHQLDVKNAFLNGDLSETVYMYQPLCFVYPRYPHHVCHLQRSLYALKQAPHAWFHRFAAYATRIRFSPSRYDSSLFIYRSGTNISYLLIYVDDIVLTSSSTALLQKIIFSLHKEFDMIDLCVLNYFLGISITRETIGMFLSHKKYAMELLK
ncbi:ribonuclease H-like domain-containing protein [Tanacetum coccineum]